MDVRKVGMPLSGPEPNSPQGIHLRARLRLAEKLAIGLSLHFC